ncbi:MAG TPA: metal-dependent hydrolase [Pyrinomonadaceae bacterium]|nr:metal-dependent hydrolase [Pyrinomonadaceae bacterium]
MPTPISHGLFGASLMAAVLPRRPRYWRPLAAGALLANAADLDFLLVFLFRSRAWHRGFTHSLVFALAVFLCFLLTLGRERVREAAAFGLAYASHVLLDFGTTVESRGVELLWPFSSDRLGLRWWGLSETPSRLPVAEILKALSIEFVLFAPPLLFLILLRRGVFGRSAAGVD